MDLEQLCTGIKVAAVSGPEGNPLAARDGAWLGNLLWLNAWVGGHCLAGVRDRSGGIDGGLSTMGPLNSWSDKGPAALSLSKVLSCQVYVPVGDHL